MRCKCRPDWWNGDIVVDLKTTVDASPKVLLLGRQMDVSRPADALPARHRSSTIYLCCCRKRIPIQRGVFMRTRQQTCGVGEELRQRDMNRIKTCKERDQWPGYSNDISTLSLPSYATNIGLSPDD